MKRELFSAFLGPAGQIIGERRAPAPWWSIAKSVLAVAVMRLHEQRALNIDDRFDDWPFTIRQLLQHTAGLATYGGPAYQAAVAAGDPVWPVEELLSRRNARRLLFPPGAGWAYSNIGYLFIRLLVERATGSGLDAALQTLVFQPLGIYQTHVAASPADLNPTCWGNPTGYDPRWVYHGLLTGPPGDAVAFLAGLLSGRLLSQASLNALLDPHPLEGAPPNRPWVQTGYGLGLMIGTMDGVGRVVGHSGVGPDTVSAVYAFLDLPGQPIAAAFAQGDDEGVVERDAVRLATERR